MAGAFSILDTEITDILTPTNDVIEGEPLVAPSFQGNCACGTNGRCPPRSTPSSSRRSLHSASKFTDIIEINKLRWMATTFDLAAGIDGNIGWKFTAN